MWSFTWSGHNSQDVVTDYCFRIVFFTDLECRQKAPRPPPSPPPHTHTHSLSEHNNGLRFTFARSSLPPESGAVVVSILGTVVTTGPDSTHANKNISVIIIITIIFLFLLPLICFLLLWRKHKQNNNNNNKVSKINCPRYCYY